MDLFAYSRQQQTEKEAPLAYRLRPRTFDHFIGQEAIVGSGTLLRRMIEADRLSSILLWGPSGSGKTTLARLIAAHTVSTYVTLNAVLDGIKELRSVIAEAQQRRSLHGSRTILFVDEIHRWNKAQQDALLPYVESGDLILIGATTENPSFEIIRPLLSRVRLFRLQPLSPDQIQQILHNALADSELGLGSFPISITNEALTYLAQRADGDARNALNALELAVLSTPPDPSGTIQIDLSVAQDSLQQRAVHYDKGADEHYDTVSAFIKSVRGTDPDAALFWLAKMVKAGEDPRFILRRLLVLAAEDIGLADPQGITVAASCAQSFEWVGMPEGLYFMALATLYLATAPKSNSTKAIFQVSEALESGRSTQVPAHLHSTPRPEDPAYLYPHDHPNHYISQQYLPEEWVGIRWYQPSIQGYEAKIHQWLASLGVAGNA